MFVVGRVRAPLVAALNANNQSVKNWIVDAKLRPVNAIIAIGTPLLFHHASAGSARASMKRSNVSLWSTDD